MCKVTGGHFKKSFDKESGSLKKQLGHFKKKPGLFNQNPGHLKRNRVIWKRNWVILKKKPGHSKSNRKFLPFLPLLGPICEFRSLTIKSFLRKVKAISGPLGQNSDTVPLKVLFNKKVLCWWGKPYKNKTFLSDQSH